MTVNSVKTTILLPVVSAKKRFLHELKHTEIDSDRTYFTVTPHLKMPILFTLNNYIFTLKIIFINVILSLQIFFVGFVLFIVITTTIHLYQVFELSVCIIMLVNRYCDIICLLMFVQKKEKLFQKLL